jgi:predicted amidophosphoribosyltransferase
MEDEGQKNQIICERCKRLKKKYYGERDLCKSCYNYLHHDKDKQRECVRKWNRENKEYFKKYHQRKRNEGIEKMTLKREEKNE